MSAPNLWRAALAAAAVAVLPPLASCESPAGKVTVLQSSGVTLAPGLSYAWAPPTGTDTPDPRVDSEILQARVKAAVDTALAAKGYRQVAEPAAAQLLVAYHVGLQDRSGAQVAGGAAGPPLCGMNDCFWGVFRTPAASAMSLDLTDRASGRLAWRATSETRRDQSHATQASLDAIVADMTRTLPGG